MRPVEEAGERGGLYEILATDTEEKRRKVSCGRAISGRVRYRHDRKRLLSASTTQMQGIRNARGAIEC